MSAQKYEKNHCYSYFLVNNSPPSLYFLAIFIGQSKKHLYLCLWNTRFSKFSLIGRKDLMAESM